MELPRDVHNTVVSKLDIDTRRSLNIYVKLKVPQELERQITKCFRPIRKYIIDDDDKYPFTAYVIEIVFRPIRTKYHLYTKYYQVSHEIFEKDVIYNMRQYYASVEYINEKDKRTERQRRLDIYRNGGDDEYYDEEFENADCMPIIYYGLPDCSIRNTAIGSTDNEELIDTHYYGEDCEIPMPRFSYANLFGQKIV